MAQGGSGGTVKSVAAGPSGNSSVVHYTNPLPDGHDETYTDIPAGSVYETFCAAFAGNTKIDVTVDASGTANGATAHR